MKVVLVFYGQARVAAGYERTAIEVQPGCTVGKAVLQAAETLPELRAFLLDADGRPRRSVLLALGPRQVDWDAPDTVCEGDTITILPPIAGGCGEPDE